MIMAIREKCADFGSESTLHGLNHITKRNQKIYRRILWIILVLLMFCLLLFYFIDGITRYLDHSTTSQITIATNTTLVFPSITICNNNMVRATYFKSNPVVIDAFVALSKTFRNPVTTNLDDASLRNNLSEIDIHNIYLEGGHQLEQMFILCTWDQVVINCSKYLTGIFTDEGGYCFTFNQQGMMETGRSGSNYGFEVYVDIQQDEYSHTAFSPGAGVKVVVHNYKTLPTLSSGGISIPTGVAAEIKMHKMEDIRLPLPYQGNGCYDGSAYNNREECIAQCANNYIINQCGCVYASGYKSNENNLRNCSLADFYSCVVIAGVNYFEDKSVEQSCNCLHHCNEIRYRAEVSVMRFPSLFATNYLNTLYQANLSHEFYRENFIHLKFYYENLLTTTLKQIPSYTFSNFAAEIGGYLGLFMGASLLTISELLEFGIECILHVCKKSKSQKKEITTM